MRGAAGLAMARVNTSAIERELDRIRSLGLEQLRLEWRRLHHSEPPKISRDLPGSARRTRRKLMLQNRTRSWDTR
jgi:hypothetical protein